MLVKNLGLAALAGLSLLAEVQRLEPTNLAHLELLIPQLLRTSRFKSSASLTFQAIQAPGVTAGLVSSTEARLPALVLTSWSLRTLSENRKNMKNKKNKRKNMKKLSPGGGETECLCR